MYQMLFRHFSTGTTVYVYVRWSRLFIRCCTRGPNLPSNFLEANVELSTSEPSIAIKTCLVYECVNALEGLDQTERVSLTAIR